jgi:23S rRNA-/tRNA-specific pseudouridylate synthase
LRELMQERKIIKQYLTIVRGVPQPSEGKTSF